MSLLVGGGGLGFPEDEEDEDGESLDGGHAFSVCGGATPLESRTRMV